MDGWVVCEVWADRWVARGMGGWPVCEVWADRWVEGEDKGEYRV